MPQLEEIRGGPRPAVAPWPTQEGPPSWPPAWYYPPPPAWYALPPVQETPTSPDQVKKLAYSVEEAAQALGVSRSAVYQLIHTSGFPSLKARGRRLISAELLAEWVRRQAGG